MVLTFFDIIKQPELRKAAETLLAQSSLNKKYQFNLNFPMLYRYRSLSSYAIDDILNDKLTLTAIGEFNDLFDGAIHRFGTDKEISLAAESRWESLEQSRIAAYLPVELLNKDSFVKPLKEHYKQESRSMFHFLSYLGTYVCCFSERFDSTLMWSHYGDSSKGVCIAYDFNMLEKDSALSNMIFPVSYSNQPLDLSTLLNDKMNFIYKYPYDTATLCAALNKVAVWDYENEWRLLFVTAASCELYLQRFAINLSIRPSAIYFGFHFLKSFFYYDYKNEPELKLITDNIMQFKKLLLYLHECIIPIFILAPQIGNYVVEPLAIKPEYLLSFIDRHFSENEPEDFKYYNTVLHWLLDYLEDCS